MAVKTTIPKGTRDFTPEKMSRREYIFDSIKKVYKKYGFLPIETPAMENLSTLMGKYGEEGDRLIFKLLNSGDFISKVDLNDWEEKNPNKLAAKICEKALRYDLTVPFARFVVQHQNEIQFPFKRYQIQPVWRADRPQKGRYREFFQCDADVIGSDSLLNEVELVQIIDEVFQTLGINIITKINNRKVLAGIAEIIGAEDKIIDITIAIDKLDKIGFDKVIDELKSKEITAEAINKLKPILELEGTNLEKIQKLKKILHSSEVGLKGIAELEETFSYINSLDIQSETELDLTLARGLNYYTGAIFEVKAKDAKIGSICGGGRYDDLTGIFGLKDVSGVGISFGADRIYDVMMELNLFPEEVQESSKIMFVNFGKEEATYCLQILTKLRGKGIKSELFPDVAKMKKQMNYADKKQIAYVALIGSEEMKSGQLTVKNMKTGAQNKYSFEELINELKK